MIEDDTENSEDLDDMSAWGLDEEGGEGEMDMSAAMGDDDMAAAMGGDDMGAAMGMDGGGTTAPEKTPELLAQQESLERFGDIEITLDTILGTTQMPVEQFLKLGRGAIIELDQTKDEDVSLHANGVEVAKGDIQIDQDRISIQVTQATFKNKMYHLE